MKFSNHKWIGICLTICLVAVVSAQTRIGTSTLQDSPLYGPSVTHSEFAQASWFIPSDCGAQTIVDSVWLQDETSEGGELQILSAPSRGQTFSRGSQMEIRFRLKPTRPGQKRARLMIHAGCSANQHGYRTYYWDVEANVLLPNWRVHPPKFAQVGSGNQRRWQVQWEYEVTGKFRIYTNEYVTTNVWFATGPSSRDIIPGIAPAFETTLDLGLKNGGRKLVAQDVSRMPTPPENATHLVAYIDHHNVVQEAFEDDNEGSVKVPEFRLLDIPQIMKNRGWPTAASLLERWFNNSPYQTGDSQRGDADPRKGSLIRPWSGGIVSSAISFDWILRADTSGFVKKVAKSLVTPTTPAPIGVPGTVENKFFALSANNRKLDFPDGNNFNDIVRRWVSAQSKYAFGNFSTSGKELHAQRVANFAVSPREMYMIKPVVSEVFAALGSFNIYAVPKGVARRSGNQINVTVSEIGLYVCDSFDFEDSNGEKSQGLGYWRSPDGFSAFDISDLLGIGVGGGWFRADNSKFRTFREELKFGRDYVVMTKPKIYKLNPPYKYSISRR